MVLPMEIMFFNIYCGGHFFALISFDITFEEPVAITMQLQLPK